MTSIRDKRRKRPAELECTAYHEAGHAVAAFALRRAVRRVSVVPDVAADSVGRCAYGSLADTFRPDVDNASSKTRARAECVIMLALAGGIAEALFKGRHNHGGAGRDYASALD